MEAQLNAFIRCDLLGASCSYSTLWKPSPCLASRVLCLSSSLERYNRVSHGLGSWTLSSQSVDKTEINGGTDQFFGGSSNLRSYENAMEALSSLITSKKRGDRSRFSGRYGKLERMMMYIKILGLEKKIDELKIIHVAGTKGKGSTCAFCEAILHECGFHTGLFTSPHLIDVRERFRLDGTDISEEKFLHYFWDCWDQLKEKVTEDLPMPPLFQFLTIMAFKIFICEKVDVCIIEVGLGGTRDSTNVIKEPVVCGITSLGMDHMETLGDTLGKIASHKAGIFKPNIPAFTVSQLPEAMDVLDHRAQQLRVELEVVAPLSCKISKALRLGLAGDHQFVNAGLAVALCKCWLQRTGDWRKLCAMEQEESELPDAFLRGLSLVRLPGRAQIVNDTVPKSSSSSSCGELVFYLDGAHSPESMDVCARWFSNAVKGHIDSASPSDLFSSLPRSETKSLNGFLPPELQIVEQDHKITKQILLFNCMELRNPQILLPRLVDTCASLGIQFSKALFVPGISRYNKVTSGASMASLNAPVEDLSWQFNLQMIWEHIIRSNDFEDDRRIENDSVKFDSIEGLSRHEFLYEDGSNRDVKYNCYCQSSVVIPSLPLAIKWLRDYVKQNPSFKVQVLVTGSLHLVGDVLKLLRL